MVEEMLHSLDKRVTLLERYCENNALQYQTIVEKLDELRESQVKNQIEEAKTGTFKSIVGGGVGGGMVFGVIKAVTTFFGVK